jgi:hypothetical protein
MGESVAGAGDVNGDGFADVIVGAADYGWGNVDEGAAFVFLGNSAGRPTLARQRRGDGSGIPVQPWGASEDVDAFAVELRASHPQGAGRVRAEFEACAAGTPFGDAACTTATTAWTLLSGGTEDVLLTADLTGLTEGTLYHWRARVQHAEPTGALPAEPAHGPWRRVSAQAGEADIRTASLPACSNGLDDDGDAEIDYPDDPGCAGAADASEDQEGLVCDDGLDNDGDGNADFPDDAGCRLVTSGNESPQCQDGLNNDNQAGIDHDGGLSLDLAPLDGLIDAAFNPATPPVGAPDPQCNAAWKNKEKASACGLGFELALLLPLLEARRRRARR